MRFGVSGTEQEERGSPEEIAKTAETAEKAGFDLFGFGDSQCLYREIYSTLAVTAANTRTIDVGPIVTNPVTRHPVVSASGMCTLAEISNERAVFGIASGDSAVRTLGQTPADLSTIKEAVLHFKELIQGETITLNGVETGLHWVDEYDVPVFLTADGPGTQTLAGMVADTVIIGSGKQPEIVNDHFENIASGADEASRDPEEIEKWVKVAFNMDTDREKAVEELKPSLAASAHHCLSYAMKKGSLQEDQHVPDEFVEPIKELVTGYDSTEHSLTGSANVDLLERLELTEYLIDRYAVVGTPEECVDQLQTIVEMDDVDGIYIIPQKGIENKGKRTMIEWIGDDILSELKASD